MTPSRLTRTLDRLALEVAAVWSGRTVRELAHLERAGTRAAAATSHARRVTGRA